MNTTIRSDYASTMRMRDRRRRVQRVIYAAVFTAIAATALRGWVAVLEFFKA